jgi:hypothetical protein
LTTPEYVPPKGERLVRRKEGERVRELCVTMERAGERDGRPAVKKKREKRRREERIRREVLCVGGRRKK